MNGHCPSCGRTYNVRVRRGDRIANHACPTCDVPLRGVTAGAGGGRYLCPVEDAVVTLGLTGWQLDQPYCLDFQPGPDALGDRHRDQPYRHEQGCLSRVHGRVLGAGAVVNAQLNPYEKSVAAGLVLEPVDEPGEPDGWITNEPLTYRRCVACGGRVPNLPRHRPAEPWTPRRRNVLRGRARADRRLDLVAQGPHPAGSLACLDCDPRGVA
ncbi:hypothetical protein [Frankia sp. R43]|uniref:hypothetical protein n=1 Tax=Frankia sp. R43 TaxID=269536 RepID=UPI000AD4F8C9|nr:hypothetical protein [Frankia sp. R43]